MTWLGWILVLLPVALVAVAVVSLLVNPRRMHAAARTMQWVHQAPTTAHSPLTPWIEAYRLTGCQLEGYALIDLGPGSPIPAAVMVHPEGVVVDLAVFPEVGGSHVSTSATSMLADARTVLETRSRQGSLAGPWQLVEVLDGAPPHAILAQHLATRAWLVTRGVGHLPTPLGHGARLVEHGARLVGEQRPPSLWTVVKLALNRFRPDLGPLPGQQAAPARVAALAASLGRPGGLAGPDGLRGLSG